MGAKLFKPEITVLHFERDFAVDPLAAGTASLGDLPDNFVVISSHTVVTGVATATSTLTIGEDGGGDADGYSADVLASYTTGIAKPNKGALVFDATAGDTMYIPHTVIAAKDGVLVTVAVATLAAGKVEVFFAGFQA